MTKREAAARRAALRTSRRPTGVAAIGSDRRRRPRSAPRPSGCDHPVTHGPRRVTRGAAACGRAPAGRQDRQRLGRRSGRRRAPSRLAGRRRGGCGRATGAGRRCGSCFLRCDRAGAAQLALGGEAIAPGGEAGRRRCGANPACPGLERGAFRATAYRRAGAADPGRYRRSPPLPECAGRR